MLNLTGKNNNEHKLTSIEIEKGHLNSAVTSLLRRTRDSAVKKSLLAFRGNADKLESLEELHKAKLHLEEAASLPKLSRRFAIPLIESDYAKLAEEVSKGVRFEEMNRAEGKEKVHRKKTKKAASGATVKRLVPHRDGVAEI